MAMPKRRSGGNLAEVAASMGDDEMPMPMDDESGGMGGSEDEEEGEYDLDEDVFADHLAIAFPELADSPERMDALKEAIRACVRKDMGGGYEE